MHRGSKRPRTVAGHYGSVAKHQSGFIGVFRGLREHNNLMKRCLIERVVSGAVVSAPEASFCFVDMCCGRGGDVGKWAHAVQSRQLKHGLVLCFDASETAMEECWRRQQSVDAPAVQFVNFAGTTADDFFGRRLFARYSPVVHGATMMFALNYVWASRSVWLEGLCACLHPGGVVGLVFADSARIEDGTVPRSVISNPTPSGYTFTLDGLVDCPEQRVSRAAVVSAFEGHGLELLEELQLTSSSSLPAGMSQYEARIASVYCWLTFRKRVER